MSIESPQQKKPMGERLIAVGNVVTGVALVAGALLAIPALVGAAAGDIALGAPFKQKYREWKANREANKVIPQ